MAWKNWGDHPAVSTVTVIASLVTIIGFGYFVYDRYFQNNRKIMSVSLLSDRGIDYSHFRRLLKESKWEEANQETLMLMLKATNREEKGFINTTLMRQFPCKDLLTIEKLWSTASQGKFGFRVQQGIWKRIGGYQYTMGNNLDLFSRFVKVVEWNKDINFSLNAPVGHLPVFSSGSQIGGIANTYRVVECDPSN